jgi:hypothetical protein
LSRRLPRLGPSQRLRAVLRRTHARPTAMRRRRSSSSMLAAPDRTLVGPLCVSVPGSSRGPPVRPALSRSRGIGALAISEVCHRTDNSRRLALRSG